MHDYNHETIATNAMLTTYILKNGISIKKLCFYAQRHITFSDNT